MCWSDARWIYSTWWTNSAVVIQNDSPAAFGNAGGIDFDNVTVLQAAGDERGWLCTHVDPSTPIVDVRGTVAVQPKVACKIDPGKPTDVSDLRNITVRCL